MKKIILALLLISSVAQAQHVLSTRLQKAINTAEQFDQEFSVRIEMLDKVDAFELHKEYIQNQTPIQERAVETVSALQEKAKQSQEAILAFIKTSSPESYNNLRKYWIVNHICIEAQKELIYELGRREDVAFIDLNTDLASPLEPIEVSENSVASSDALESGLVAINAPALWDLGYTGKGLLVYDYDTGVSAEHPVFKNRFLANHFPMEQSWHGYFRDFPNELNSDHGTHTLGTIIGEGLSTGDTIGVAPGAYWMACDLVTTTVEALPPLEAIVAAYEWALDADNNPETTLDIPHVINNSWRWRDEADTVHCNDYIVDLMNAMEAVGIANVFSGGNSGPNNTSINAPQRINTTIVNTFSVGSINANVEDFPISTFSTRGPIQCPATDSSLIIHPEVVAPGQGVRSAVGLNSFDVKSGTSMAAPHVSGAVLLLKEAFPELSGADILTALYFTAIDMGDAGEDNTYGMGLIDCLAAFEYLSLTNTPTNPLETNTDLAITKIIEPSPLTFCSSTVTPSYSIKYTGDTPIDSLFFSLKLNGELIESLAWTGTLTSGDILDHSFSSITIPEDSEVEHEIQIHVTSPNLVEKDLYNNYRTQRFSWHGSAESPFIETFESNDFSSNEWIILNEDENRTWEITETNGLDDSYLSAQMKMYNYQNKDQKDVLLSPNINLNPTEDYFLSFDYAHQHRGIANLKDSLIVEVSADCGATYKRVFTKGGETLETTDTLDINFEPIYSTHWANENIPLSDFIDEASTILLRFTSINGKQNNLYLDNIIVATLEEFSTIELDSEQILLSPNPTNENIQLVWKGNHTQDIQIDLIDLSGRVIEHKEFPSSRNLDLNWNLSEFEPGYYFFRFILEKGILTKRFIKN